MDIRMRSAWLGVLALTLAADPGLAQRGMGRGGPHQPPGATVARGPAHGRAPAGSEAGTGRGPQATQGPRSMSAASHLERHPELAKRVAPLVPEGLTAQEAAAGFRNWGQFVAALQVSKNLGIPFADLKSLMTGPENLPLGKAIQQLRPELPAEQVRSAVREAEREAKRLEREARKERRHGATQATRTES
jgi:hypothetical protein